MTQTNDRFTDLDDDMPAEYDLSRLKVVRRNSERAERLRREGYSVTIHHADGTSTTRYVSPLDILVKDLQHLIAQCSEPTATPEILSDRVLTAISANLLIKDHFLRFLQADPTTLQAAIDHPIAGLLLAQAKRLGDF